MDSKNLKAIFIILVLVVFSYLIFHQLDEELLLLLAHLENRPILFSILNISLLSLDAILPIPSSILMFLNGKVFGILAGTILSILGATLGNLLAYQIGYHSNKIIYKGEHYKLSQNLLSNWGIGSIMITRAIPVIAECVMMYAGLQKRKLKPIMTYAIIGYIPVCFVYSLLGSLMFETKGFFLALVSTIVFSLVVMYAISLKRDLMLERK